MSAVSKSVRSATAKATSETSSQSPMIRRQAAAVATTDAGRVAVQIAARPEPTAMAGAPTKPQSRNENSTTRVVSGAVVEVVANASVATPTAA